jgi:two-component system response regulator AtoC
MREDLFYRLKVITVRLPPLRERKEDILPLARHFLEAYRLPLRKEIGGLSPEATRLLLAHPWPGNVRELQATIQRAVTLTKGHALTPDDLFPDDLPPKPPGGETCPHHLNEAVREAERRYLQEVLQSVGGQRTRAAHILGISRKTLWKKLKALGLD